MGPGRITPSEIVRAVVVGNRAVPMAVGSAVVMIWKRHVGTGRVGAVEAHRTAWCSIMMTRARPGGTATNEGPADAQGRPPATAENASGAVAETVTETTQAGTSRGGIAIVTVTVTVTGLTGVNVPVLYYATVSCATIYRRLRMPDRSQSVSTSLYHCAPKK